MNWYYLMVYKVLMLDVLDFLGSSLSYNLFQCLHLLVCTKLQLSVSIYSKHIGTISTSVLCGTLIWDSFFASLFGHTFYRVLVQLGPQNRPQN